MAFKRKKVLGDVSDVSKAKKRLSEGLEDPIALHAEYAKLIGKPTSKWGAVDIMKFQDWCFERKKSKGSSR
jgi:hypothetical protein